MTDNRTRARPRCLPNPVDKTVRWLADVPSFMPCNIREREAPNNSSCSDFMFWLRPGIISEGMAFHCCIFHCVRTPGHLCGVESDHGWRGPSIRPPQLLYSGRGVSQPCWVSGQPVYSCNIDKYLADTTSKRPLSHPWFIYSHRLPQNFRH